MPTQTAYNVIVYGGDLPGVFAAAKASAELGATANNKKVLLIVPYPSTRYKGSDGLWHTDYLLGGIMTAGGLNYWDDKGDNVGLYAQGSYADCKSQLGLGFNRIDLSDYCKNLLAQNYVDIRYSFDIFEYSYASGPRRITSVTVCGIYRDSTGKIVWNDFASSITYTADVFIDASTDGRIARVENSACTVGRFDWPSDFLPYDEFEFNSHYAGRQQAATIMVKMRLPNVPTDTPDPNQVCFYPNPSSPPKRASALWTTVTAYTNPDGSIRAFNNAYRYTDHIMIKPANAARDGYNSDEWWVNGILVFDVDGRAHERDIDEDTIFKVTPQYGYRTTDRAWIDAKKFIKDHIADIQTAFRTFDWFSGCEIVLDDHGDPVVGDILYIRESVHMAKNSNQRAHNSESNYQITKDEARTPGDDYDNGSDQENYGHCIGVAKYNCDLHPYEPSDLVSNGAYLWGLAAFQNMRSDAINPLNPVYIPYEAITTGYVANLLIPGYAANISSYAWGELRVFSHLSVLGDAAGIAAAYSCNHNIYPHQLANINAQIQAVQARISYYNGRLNK